MDIKNVRGTLIAPLMVLCITRWPTTHAQRKKKILRADVMTKTKFLLIELTFFMSQTKNPYSLNNSMIAYNTQSLFTNRFVILGFDGIRKSGFEKVKKEENLGFLLFDDI